ncbi:SPOSA6832_02811, partial [Sporobolomyces salmonicolor]
RTPILLRCLSTSSPHLASQFKPIERLTVFGAGLMGAGIAQVAAQNGVKVVMTDVSEGAVENGRQIITKSLTRIARKQSPDDESAQQRFISSVFSNLATTTHAAEAVASADLVIEAIVENLATKQELFRRLDELAPRETAFASNTSSLSITKIAEGCSDARKARFAGFHAFNPVPQMKLVGKPATDWPSQSALCPRPQVELVATERTSRETMDALLDLSKRMKKVPVQCKDTPGYVSLALWLFRPFPFGQRERAEAFHGTYEEMRRKQKKNRFIVNRLLVPYMLEAIRMVERGDASAEDVDTAMKLGAGLPMGACSGWSFAMAVPVLNLSFLVSQVRLSFLTYAPPPPPLPPSFFSALNHGLTPLLPQFVGLDTLSHIARGWRDERVSTGEIPAESVAAVEMLEGLVKVGKLGRKSGEGFFKCAFGQLIF